MTYDNPIRGRLNARFFRLFDGYIEHLLGARREARESGVVACLVVDGELFGDAF